MSTFSLGDADHRTILSYDHQTSDGYRQQTRMRRDIGSWETMLKTERQADHPRLYAVQ